MAQKDLLSEYINKILSLQEQQHQLTLSDNSLREIALEMGIDEDGWRHIQQAFEDYRTRGQGFMRYRNWNKAIQELEQALSLRPFDEPTLQGLAQSYHGRWQKDQSYNDKRNAAVYAEKCLYANPKNDVSLRLLTELGPVAAPIADEVLAPKPSSTAKLVFMIGLASAVIVTGLLLLFVVAPMGGEATQLPISKQEASEGLATGEREIPMSFVGSKTVGDLQLFLQEARFRDYSKSASFHLKGYVQGTGVELTRLQLRLELLDKRDNRIYEDKIDVIGKFDDPVRSKDLIPLTYLQHIKGRKDIHPHAARLSVIKLEWREIPELYSEASIKNILREGSATGVEIEIRERASKYSEHPKERYVFHQLELEIRNQSTQPIRQLKARIHWFNSQGKILEQQTVTMIDKSQPQLLPGQIISFSMAEKLSKLKQSSEVEGYQIILYDAE